MDGVAVHNLRHLRHLLESVSGEFVRIDLDDERVLVLERAAALVRRGAPRPPALHRARRLCGRQTSDVRRR